LHRVLTGIQSSGSVHLGNIVGAIQPALKLGRDSNSTSYFFIADLHSLTTQFDGAGRLENVASVAAAWMAFGADSNHSILYRQSAITEVGELTWYLSCFTPYGLLGRAHSFKDKSDNLTDVNAGLFTYPVLMAADMLLYSATHVPVGKDQKQHIEITRDIARSFNHRYGDIFVLPQPVIDEKTMTLPGVDGRKMSKSYNNYIDIFATDKMLKKRIMQIVTDSKGRDEAKNPEDCNIFKIYQAIANQDEIAELASDYKAGSIGYGDAKTLLFQQLVKKFGDQREAYHRLIDDRDLMQEKLEAGEEIARNEARELIQKVRQTLGFSGF